MFCCSYLILGVYAKLYISTGFVVILYLHKNKDRMRAPEKYVSNYYIFDSKWIYIYFSKLYLKHDSTNRTNTVTIVCYIYLVTMDCIILYHLPTCYWCMCPPCMGNSPLYIFSYFILLFHHQYHFQFNHHSHLHLHLYPPFLFYYLLILLLQFYSYISSYWDLLSIFDSFFVIYFSI